MVQGVSVALCLTEEGIGVTRFRLNNLTRRRDGLWS